MAASQARSSSGPKEFLMVFSTSAFSGKQINFSHASIFSAIWLPFHHFFSWNMTNMFVYVFTNIQNLELEWSVDQAGELVIRLGFGTGVCLKIGYCSRYSIPCSGLSSFSLWNCHFWVSTMFRQPTWRKMLSRGMLPGSLGIIAPQGIPMNRPESLFHERGGWTLLNPL